MEKLIKKFEEVENKKETILEDLAKNLKNNCGVINDVEISFSNIFNGKTKINVEIKLNCAWTYTARLEIYEDKTHKFSTSAGGIDNEENYLEELHIATGCLLEFVRKFDYNVFTQLNELNLEMKKLREEIAKKDYEQKLNEIKKDLVEIDIDDLIKKAENEVVEFYTIEGLYLEKNVLYKENKRFKLNGNMIAKNKIKDVIKEAYKKVA